MATIRDVAKKAQVSVATVSRVINNQNCTKIETQKKVNNAIKELNYIPNSVAKTLYTKKSNTIGVLIPDINNPFFSELYKHIEYYADKWGQQLFLFNSNYDINKEKQVVKKFNSLLIDGAVIISEKLTESDLISINNPAVILDRQISKKVSSISVNNYEGGRRAGKYLLDSKCKTIVHIKGPKYNEVSKDRTRGFCDEVKNKKINYSIVQGDYDVEKTVRLFKKIFENNSDIDGIFAGNDIIAMGVIKALSIIKTQKKITIIGFDGIKLGGYITPELTTMRQPIDKIAKNAIEIIMKEKQQVHKTFDAELLIKET